MQARPGLPTDTCAAWRRWHSLAARHVWPLLQLIAAVICWNRPSRVRGSDQLGQPVRLTGATASAAPLVRPGRRAAGAGAPACPKLALRADSLGIWIP